MRIRLPSIEIRYSFVAVLLDLGPVATTRHRLNRIGTDFCFVRRITQYVAVHAAAITAWAISNKMNDAIYCMHVKWSNTSHDLPPIVRLFLTVLLPSSPPQRC